MSNILLQHNPPESGSEIRALAFATMGLCGLMASPALIQAPKLESRIMRYELSDYESGRAMGWILTGKIFHRTVNFDARTGTLWPQRTKRL
jgi:hypothetical protein